jgi:hypothetical protein
MLQHLRDGYPSLGDRAALPALEDAWGECGPEAESERERYQRRDGGQ